MSLRRWTLARWVLAVTTCCPRPSTAEPSLEALRVEDGAIAADGRLDEPAWARAPVGGGFVERSPRSGAVPPVATEVRVLHDHEALYVGVTMSLLPGETPRALEMTRDDTEIWSDDAVTIKFDVQRDRRSTVGFAVNAAGAQIDFVALDSGRSFRLEYDALWECGTTTTLREPWTSERSLVLQVSARFDAAL